MKAGAQVSGLIEKIFVGRGNKVVVGQPLFALKAAVENAEYEIAKSKAANEELVAVARAQLELARTNAERLTCH